MITWCHPSPHCSVSWVVHWVHCTRERLGNWWPTRVLTCTQSVSLRSIGAKRARLQDRLQDRSASRAVTNRFVVSSDIGSRRPLHRAAQGSCGSYVDAGVQNG